MAAPRPRRPRTAGAGPCQPGRERPRRHAPWRGGCRRGERDGTRSGGLQGGRGPPAGALRGATIRLRFPPCEVLGPVPPEATGPGWPASAAKGEGTILLVEEEDAVRA